MRSLAVKLTLAFLLVGLTGSILVTVIIQSRTRTAFSNFIMNQEQQTLVDNLVLYYQTTGSWDGVRSNITFLRVNPPVQPSGGPDAPNAGSPFTLVGPDRIVIYSNQPNEVGKTLSKSTLTGAIALQSNNQNIGWLILTPIQRNFTANTPEANFLRNVNSAQCIGGSFISPGSGGTAGIYHDPLFT
jgi:hypothetical protein